MCRRISSAFFLPFLFAACAFLFSYYLDNKYTQPVPPPEGGVLQLDGGPVSVVHLINGWELYRGCLLTPDDFASGELPPFEQVFIGQYSDFQGADPASSPHGSATYRLQLLLPSDARNYTLELPEIHSAYRLYINGRLAAGLGDPDPASYRPVTGNSFVTFRAGERLELLFAVTDYVSFYSGILHPPAFGEAAAVSRLLTARLCLRLLACSVSLLIGLYHLAAAFFLRGHRAGIFYGLMCLFFLGSTCYPVIKVLWPGGPAWDCFECFCHSAMLLCLLPMASFPTGKVLKPPLYGLAAFGLILCLWALFSPFAMGRPDVALLFSRLLGLYTWLSAAFLTASCAHGVIRKRRYSGILLSGMAVFDCALVFDRLLPAFEPILLGWFPELGGGALVCCFGAALAGETVRRSRERLVLEGRIDSISRLVEMQRRYYPVLLEGIRDARAARHDLRHHMRLIRALAADGNLSDLTRYLAQYQADTDSDSALFDAQNYVTDALLRHFRALADERGIPFAARVDVTEDLAIPDAELAIVLGNLLENALEASAPLPPEQAHIEVFISVLGHRLGIVVKNNFDGTLSNEDGMLLSRKGREHGGVGLQSVRSAARRLHGSAHFSAQGTTFTASVFLRLEERARPVASLPGPRC